MTWQPIETLQDNVVVLLYQPKTLAQDEGMIVGSIRHEKYGVMVDTANIGGYECENDIDHPTHWMPLPKAPS